MRINHTSKADRTKHLLVRTTVVGLAELRAAWATGADPNDIHRRGYSLAAAEVFGEEALLIFRRGE